MDAMSIHGYRGGVPGDYKSCSLIALPKFLGNLIDSKDSSVNG